MNTLVWIIVELMLLCFAMIAVVVLMTAIGEGWRAFKEAWREESDYDPYE